MPGLCATDVAYCLWACPQAGVLDHEEQLVRRRQGCFVAFRAGKLPELLGPQLEYYHSQLAAELSLRGEYLEGGLDTLRLQYRKAFLDLCR